jgi:hypothetical protein
VIDHPDRLGDGGEDRLHRGELARRLGVVHGSAWRDENLSSPLSPMSSSPTRRFTRSALDPNQGATP